ncbi:hypothetical protein [Spirosoma validum]|uniref:Uncharacterized protein n=1 Tax=Spirosoma validum TaxID=2771355 RepID=A0A927B1T6_9BACT|nr:hypothetical protein [Spirosoma validum]MBD2753809.1 hypothetical protein [Spirosoma validum]
MKKPTKPIPPPPQTVKKKNTNDPFTNVVLLLIFNVGMGAFYFIQLLRVSMAVKPWGKQLINLIDGSKEYGGVYPALAIGGLGYLLFLLKLKQQFWYGILECAFAFASAGLTAISIQETIKKDGLKNVLLLSAATAVYLIVRGGGNIFEGREKEFIGKSKLEKYL